MRPFLDHEIGDGGDAGIEHLIGHRESVGEGGLLIGDAEQILIGNDDERVDAFLQFGDARVRNAQAPLTFEMEGLRHHADGEYSHFARDLRNHGRGARAGAAAHARGHEGHVRAG